MKSLQLIVLLATAMHLSSGAVAQGLLGKLSKGAEKAAGFVGETAGKAASSLGDTIDSTVDLATGEETPQETREALDAMAAESLNRLFLENEATGNLFYESAGYAVFDIRKITFGVAAGLGRGVAVSNETSDRTYMLMGSGGVGWSFGLGGFESQVVILFETIEGFESFIVDGYDATAEAGSMFGDDKIEQTVRFIDGRSIFVQSQKGWKVSATAAGTKYWVDDTLN